MQKSSFSQAESTIRKNNSNNVIVFTGKIRFRYFLLDYSSSTSTILLIAAANLKSNSVTPSASCVVKVISKVL
jgi:hypothetical protein